jgi:hypothetical protein
MKRLQYFNNLNDGDTLKCVAVGKGVPFTKGATYEVFNGEYVTDNNGVEKRWSNDAFFELQDDSGVKWRDMSDEQRRSIIKHVANGGDVWVVDKSPCFDPDKKYRIIL